MRTSATCRPSARDAPTRPWWRASPSTTTGPACRSTSSPPSTPPRPRLLVIQPWDKNAFDPIQRSIQRSELGLNPQSDGVVIRLAIPELTEERRKQFVRQVGQKTESARVALRNIRRDAQDELRTMVKDKDISQDDEHRAHDQLDKIVRDFTQRIDQEGSAKERELLEV